MELGEVCFEFEESGGGFWPELAVPLADEGLELEGEVLSF